jgi:Tol biopolymer transport system component
MPEETHEDVRRRLFEAAWDAPTFAPAPERTIARARRRAALTISGGVAAMLAAAVAIVLAAGSVPLVDRDRTAIDGSEGDPREYLVNVTTGETTAFTELPRGAWLYEISPDGSQMTFVTDASGRNQVWMMDMDGSDLRQLTDDPYEAIDPDWSPSGSSIVFVGFGGKTTRGLFVVDVESGRTSHVRQDADPLPKGGDAWNPDWSPGGDEILYHSSMPLGDAPPRAPGWTTQTRGQVRSIDIETGRVSVVAGGLHVDVWDATWSDSGRIAFLQARFISSGEPTLALWVMNRDGSEEQMLRPLVVDDAWSPAWSPDERRVAYAVTSRGHSSIHVLDIATGEDRPIGTGEYAKWIDGDTLLVQETLPSQ